MKEKASMKQKRNMWVVNDVMEIDVQTFELVSIWIIQINIMVKSLSCKNVIHFALTAQQFVEF